MWSAFNFFFHEKLRFPLAILKFKYKQHAWVHVHILQSSECLIYLFMTRWSWYWHCYISVYFEIQVHILQSADYVWLNLICWYSSVVVTLQQKASWKNWYCYISVCSFEIQIHILQWADCFWLNFICTGQGTNVLVQLSLYTLKPHQRCKGKCACLRALYHGFELP